MSGTKYIASNWRVPENSNSSKNDNYSLDFSTTSSTINCGNITALNGKTNASWSFWLNCGTTSVNGIMNQWGTGSDRLIYAFIWLAGGRIDIYVGGNLGFRVSSNAVISALSTGQWFNLIITYDGTQAITSERIKVYIDNQELTGNTTGGPTSLNNSTTDFVIGTYPSGAYWNGQMSDVALFDYTLGIVERLVLNGNSITGAGNPMALKPPPVAYFPLGDNSAGDPVTQPNVSVDDASVFSFDASTTSQFIDIFDGTSGAGPIQFTASDDFSISAWIKTSSLSVQNYILSFRGTALIWLYTSSSSGNIRANLYIRDNSSNVTIISTFNNSTGWIPADTWTNVVITRNGTLKQLNIYLNGQSAQTTKADTTTDDFTLYDKISIGNDNYAGGRYWYDGEISNVAIFDSIVDASTIYNSGVPGDISVLNPVAHYKLDQSANWDVGGSGNWTIPDASGNGNDGTSSGMTSGNLVLSDLTRNLPYENYSLSFDAASTETISATVPTLNNATALTFSGWFKKDSGNVVGFESRPASDDRVILYWWTDNNVYWSVRNGSLSANINSLLTNYGSWNHLVGVFDGASNSIELYINGVSVAFSNSGQPSSTSANLSTNFIIGLSNALQYNTGNICQLSIFDNALTSTEVLKLYANGLPQDLTNFTPQPAHWWTLGKDSFWNGSDWIARDMISSNDGTSANMAVSDLVGDAPRSEANGTGTNMDIPTNLVGSAGFSDKNAYSVNMSPSARVTDTP